MIKGKVTRDGVTFEVECQTAADFNAVLSSFAPVKNKVGRPVGSKNGVHRASNAVKHVTELRQPKSGQHWTSTDIGIVARVITEKVASGKTWGTSTEARRRLRDHGDNPRRTLAAVSMTVMEIKRYLKGRADGVPARVSRALAQLGYQPQVAGAQVAQSHPELIEA